MTGPDAAPTAEDVIRDAIRQTVRDTLSPTLIAAAVVAAVRGMSPETLAELIGGELVDRVIFGGRRIRYVCSPPEYEDPS